METRTRLNKMPFKLQVLHPINGYLDVNEDDLQNLHDRTSTVKDQRSEFMSKSVRVDRLCVCVLHLRLSAVNVDVR